MKSSDLKTLWNRNAIFKCDFSMRRLIVDWLHEPKRIVALLLWTLKHWCTETLHMPFFFLHRSGARESQYQTMCVFIAFRTVRFIQSICTHTMHRYRGWDVSIVNCRPYLYSDTIQSLLIYEVLSLPNHGSSLFWIHEEMRIGKRRNWRMLVSNESIVCTGETLCFTHLWLESKTSNEGNRSLLF